MTDVSRCGRRGRARRKRRIISFRAPRILGLDRGPGHPSSLWKGTIMSRDTFKIAPWIRYFRLGRPSAFKSRSNDRRRLRPGLLELEGRQLLTSFLVVSSTNAAAPGGLATIIGKANTDSGANTITFSPSVFSTPQTIDLGGTELELSDTDGLQTIIGPAVGVTIDGGDASRVFAIDSGVTAALSGLTMTRGSASGSGGGLLDSGTATLFDCTITDNTAGTFGGGIESNGSELIVSDSTISDNQVIGGSGGGLSNSDTASVTVSDCTIKGNTSATGGGLFNAGQASLFGCSISGNSSGSDGGGVDNESSVGSHTVND